MFSLNGNETYVLRLTLHDSRALKLQESAKNSIPRLHDPTSGRWASSRNLRINLLTNPVHTSGEAQKSHNFYVEDLLCREFNNDLLMTSANRIIKGSLLTQMGRHFSLTTPLTIYPERSVQKCRKIYGLGCENRAHARARVTQPSPHIFLHVCILTEFCQTQIQ